MKVTVVPAQITTVEDRVAGNLGMSQMILFAIPIFGGSALFAGLPPVMGGALYKYIVIGVVALISCILAIRIKGRILLLWLLLIMRYNLRPAYYLYDKHSLVFRDIAAQVKEIAPKTVSVKKKAKTHTLPHISTTDAARIMSLIENPAANLRFEANKRGGLYVRITEIKE